MCGGSSRLRGTTAAVPPSGGLRLLPSHTPRPPSSCATGPWSCSFRESLQGAIAIDRAVESFGRRPTLNTGEVRAGQIAFGEVGMGDVRSAQISACELRTKELRAGKVRRAQVGKLHQRTVQVRAGKIRPGHACT